MMAKKEGIPALQVQITILKAKPTPGQMAAWRRLWDLLLASRDTNASDPCPCEDKEAPDPAKG